MHLHFSHLKNDDKFKHNFEYCQNHLCTCQQKNNPLPTFFYYSAIIVTCTITQKAEINY